MLAQTGNYINKTKVCPSCNKRKNKRLFILNKSGKEGLGCYCKKCSKMRSKSWRSANAARSREIAREWMRRNRRAPNGKYRFHQCRLNAIARGMEFKLELKDFTELFNKDCFYCGRRALGFDRFNNRQGYIKENVLPCCRQCNIAKNNRTFGDFVLMCYLVYKRHCPK